MSRISCNKETIYQGANKQKRNQRERHAFFLAKPYGGPTNSIGRVDDLFQKAVIAKKNIYLKNSTEPDRKISSTTTKLEHPPDSETETKKSC